MTRGRERGDIVVTGGRGGIAVALDDLTRAVVDLRTGSMTLADAGHGVDRLELWSLAALEGGPEVLALLARAEWRRSVVLRALRAAAGDLEDLAGRTRRAVLGYVVAEREAELAVRLARGSVHAVTRSAQALGGPLGLLRDGRAAPATSVPVDAASRVRIEDLASIMTSQSLVSGRAVVRVVEIPRPDGASAWLLQIPGTQAWHPRAGPVAHDLTSDVRLLGQEHGALTAAALDALTRAQSESGRLGLGDPVMVSGHSLGGIAALTIGADPLTRERFHVTHVVTAGAPVGHLTVPDDLVVLSLEHEDDVVTAADLVRNPDRANWTTVRRDVPGGRMVTAGRGVPEHAALTYRETARLATVAAESGVEASLVAWTASAAPFVGRVAAGTSRRRPEQRVRDYRVGRVTQSE